MRLLLGHLRTGDVVAELDGQADYTDELSAAGSARATIPLDAVPPEIDIRAVTTPWRHYLALDHDGVVLWAGPIVPRRRAPNTSAVEVSVSGLWTVFDRRVLARLGDWAYTDPQADVILTYRSLPGVALDIVQVALNRPHGELPLVLPRLNTSGDLERRYYGHELASTGERLKQLTADENGPDLHFHPRYRPDRSGIEWVFRVGQPHLTQPGIAWHFDEGGNLLGYGWDEDGSVLASTILVPGDGMERGRLIGQATNDALPRVGWPALDTVISDHASEKQPAVLDAHAIAYLDAYRTGVTRDTAIVRTDTHPRLGTYLVGDQVMLTPRPDRATEPGARHRRITAIAYRSSTPDTAELTLAPAPATL
ncbi:MAG: hypothetical protein GEV28_26075 [Actinophytocola sp.]|uniref:hypothetical protein n=1 Tax=Actinophytocola sp. TaxID=1872138 RepID=UPI0013236E07|nr:hypothetical protein [Actinophytocola sp.]MPZ83671.1 hypothetical protein [Actinophytocola sp.]